MSRPGAGLTRRRLGIAAGGAALAGLGFSGCATPTAGAGTGGAAGAARPWPFLIGADVTWLPEDEALGATYWRDGVQRDALAILRDAGFNAIKLRLFVDPARGYSQGKVGGPWGSIASTIAFARRIREAGLHLSLTLHYSDTWADPEHQEKPAAWATLPLPGLVDAVYRHTADALGQMAAAGVAPDLVVIGNEITFGMLWPEGRIAPAVPTGNPVTDARHRNAALPGGHDRLAALLKAGIAAARGHAPGAKVVLHNHLGRHWEIVRDWMDNLLERDVRFDAAGFSAYQQLAQGDWEHSFDQFVRRYPDHGFLVLEYSSRKRYVNDLVFAHPQGWGSYIWEPIRHQEAIFTREGVNAGGGPRPDLLAQGANAAEAPGAAAPLPASVPAEPQFEHPGGRYDAIPELLALYRAMARDYGLTPGEPFRPAW